MKNSRKIIMITTVALATAALAGCSSLPSFMGGSDSNQASTSANAPDAHAKITSINDQNNNFAGETIHQNTSQLAATNKLKAEIAALPHKVYFGFAEYSLSGKAKAAAAKNANLLVRYPNEQVLIAGNTDPRGSQEYNFHLGQRRADAVKDYFLSEGVSEHQLCTVSYGELRPAASPSQFGGSTTRAYQLDRRVELVYGQTCKGAAKGHV